MFVLGSGSHPPQRADHQTTTAQTSRSQIKRTKSRSSWLQQNTLYNCRIEWDPHGARWRGLNVTQCDMFAAGQCRRTILATKSERELTWIVQKLIAKNTRPQIIACIYLLDNKALLRMSTTQVHCQLMRLLSRLTRKNCDQIVRANTLSIVVTMKFRQRDVWDLSIFHL